jgi:hypothetical protein
MLGFMAMDYFRQSPLLFYPLVALAIFMGVFLGVALRTVLSVKHGYDALAALPLSDDEQGRAARVTKEVGCVRE